MNRENAFSHEGSVQYDTARAAILLHALGGKRSSVCLGEILGVDQKKLLTVLHDLREAGILEKESGEDRWACHVLPDFAETFLPQQDDTFSVVRGQRQHGNWTQFPCESALDCMMFPTVRCRGPWHSREEQVTGGPGTGLFSGKRFVPQPRGPGILRGKVVSRAHWAGWTLPPRVCSFQGQNARAGHVRLLRAEAAMPG